MIIISASLRVESLSHNRSGLTETHDSKEWVLLKFHKTMTFVFDAPGRSGQPGVGFRLWMERSKRKEADCETRHLEEGLSLFFEDMEITKEEGI